MHSFIFNRDLKKEKLEIEAENIFYFHCSIALFIKKNAGHQPVAPYAKTHTLLASEHKKDLNSLSFCGIDFHHLSFAPANVLPLSLWEKSKAKANLRVATCFCGLDHLMKKRVLQWWDTQFK